MAKDANSKAKEANPKDEKPSSKGEPNQGPAGAKQQSRPSMFSMAIFFAIVAAMIAGLQFIDRPSEPATTTTTPAKAGKDGIVDKRPKPLPLPRTKLTKPLKRGLMTHEMLKEHDGTVPGKPLYLAILGEIFDVSAGEAYYGVEGGYGFFSGIDGSRAFVTGEFNETGLIPDLEGFTAGQYEGVASWNDFYHKEEKYKYVAKLIGHYYDEDGRPTAARKKVDDMKGLREVEKAEEKAFDKKYPSCNSRWAQQTGGEVWCSTKSGGIDRKWAGVPRKYVTKKGTKDESKKCVCVEVEKLPTLDQDTFERYEKCEATAERCST